MDAELFKVLASEAARNCGVMPKKEDGSENLEAFMFYLCGIYSLYEPIQPVREPFWKCLWFWEMIIQSVQLAIFVAAVIIWIVYG